MKLTNLIYVATLLLLPFVVASCSDQDNEEQPNIVLSQSELLYESDGETKTISIVANGNWTVTDLPEWVQVDNKVGESSGDITFTVAANKNTEPRVCLVRITRSSAVAVLTIRQDATGGINGPMWQPLSVTKFNNYAYDIWDNGIGRTYSFDVAALFIHSDIASKIYIGNMIDSRLNSIKDISEVKGYTYNPITFSTAAPVLGIDIYKTVDTPSKEVLDAFAQTIIDKLPSNNYSAGFDEKRYDSRRQLNLIGMSNMGISLDAIFTGVSYLEEEMKKKTGLIFSFQQTIFSIDMDAPYTGNLLKGEVKAEDMKDGNLSYISSISYGRVGVMVIESDYEKFEVDNVVKKLMLGDAVLTAKEQTVIADLVVGHITLGENSAIIRECGGSELISKYYSKLSNQKTIVHPIRFSVSNFTHHGMHSMSFKQELE